ncbi:MAG: HAMP domain-containing sensor histidine kinase, partial [Polyangiales bacterium]
NADAQLELIEEMLDMNNLAAGTLTLSTARVDLTKLVEGVVTGLRQRATSAALTLELAIDRDLTPVTGDPERLAQITRQLVSYALRASPRGGRVGVTLARSGSQLQLTVQDSGEGLDSALVPTVFEDFDEETAPDSLRGMGLKLAILRRLVELHSGTIHAESEGRGRGARFVVKLPAS